MLTMLDPTQGPSSADSRFDALLAEYVAAEEGGQTPNREQWLARYPEHAAEAREVIVDKISFARFAPADLSPLLIEPCAKRKADPTSMGA